MAYSPRITRGATTFDLTTANGVVLGGTEEQEDWESRGSSRPGRHGGFQESNLFVAEIATVRGLIRSAPPPTVAGMRTRLGALLNALGAGSEDVLFRLQDDREIVCRVVGRARSWFEGNSYTVANFEFTLRSVDPLWRALADTTNATTLAVNGETTLVVTNAGDAPAPFQVDITPASGSIASTNFVIQRDLPTPVEKFQTGKATVAAGAILRFDTQTGLWTDSTGALGAADALAEFCDGFPFFLMPGANTLRLKQNGSPAPNVSYTVRHRARFWSP